MTSEHELRSEQMLYDAAGRPVPRSRSRTDELGYAVCICGAVSTILSPTDRSAWIGEHRAALRWETRNGWRDADGDPIGPLQPPTI